ncbi:hypothetical protein K440DRAFT_642028 [Wilcoxina mikolae CBS 423.85]|nr:hypothetical protein K440DRAFT_642028 [Wilcoxina mikolae CBS 423.85]
MADSLGLPFNQCNSEGSEILHISSDFATIPAMHNTSDTPDISMSDRINKAESSFEPVEYYMEEYIIKKKKGIDDDPEDLSDHTINCIQTTVNVKHEIIDAYLLDLNESLTAEVKELEGFESIQGPNKELVAAQQEIDELEKELQIKKHRSVRLQRWLEKCKSESESTD